MKTYAKFNAAKGRIHPIFYQDKTLYISAEDFVTITNPRPMNVPGKALYVGSAEFSAVLGGHSSGQVRSFQLVNHSGQLITFINDGAAMQILDSATQFSDLVKQYENDARWVRL